MTLTSAGSVRGRRTRVDRGARLDAPPAVRTPPAWEAAKGRGSDAFLKEIPQKKRCLGTTDGRAVAGAVLATSGTDDLRGPAKAWVWQRWFMAHHYA